VCNADACPHPPACQVIIDGRAVYPAAAAGLPEGPPPSLLAEAAPPPAEKQQVRRSRHHRHRAITAMA
jgi:hypothetical protein